MKYNNFLVPAALLLASGCASFNSGDILASRTDLRRMLSDRDVKPFSELRVVWKNFPYKNPTDAIGEGSINAGGLIRWPAKLLLPVGFALVALQGFSEIVKRIGYLLGVHNMDVHYERPLQ